MQVTDAGAGRLRVVFRQEDGNEVELLASQLDLNDYCEAEAHFGDIMVGVLGAEQSAIAQDWWIALAIRREQPDFDADRLPDLFEWDDHGRGELYAALCAAQGEEDGTSSIDLRDADVTELNRVIGYGVTLHKAWEDGTTQQFLLKPLRGRDQIAAELEFGAKRPEGAPSIHMAMLRFMLWRSLLHSDPEATRELAGRIIGRSDLHLADRIIGAITPQPRDADTKAEEGPNRTGGLSPPTSQIGADGSPT